MNPGKLDRKVTIQVRTATKDATGSRVEAWADHASVWAEYVTHKGSEAVDADSERSQDNQQFRIRYREDFTAPDAASNYRVLYNLRFYNIKGITQEGRKSLLLLDTVAIQSIS